MNVDWSPDGKHLVTSHENDPVTFWFAKYGRRDLSILPIAESIGARSVQFSADGQQLLIAGPESTTTVWHVVRRQPIGPQLRQAGKLLAAYFVPDTPWIATISDRSVRLWDGRDGLPLGPEWFCPSRIVSAAMTKDQVLAIGAVDGNVHAIPLHEWLTPATGSWEELRLQAEIVSSQRFAETSLVPLRSGEWLERWQRLRC